MCCNTWRSLFCIAHWGQSDIVQHTKLKKHKLAIWSKILSQKAAAFPTTRKGEEGVVLQKVCLQSTWPNTAPHFDEWIVFLDHRNDLWKKIPCSRTKYEWTVVNLLAFFAVLKSVEIWTMTNIDIICWTVLSLQVWNSYQCLLVFYTRDRNTNKDHLLPEC